uniref:Sugar phosphate transporter domain-containing protein n=1 Tax=Gossypium raimondii TaxID=29730 RepID=A0A0D2RVZ6_GOSRA|nr:hypothetical protein B456_006G135900 [Gossypium raimondii]
MSSTQQSSSTKKQTLFIASLIILWYSSNIGVLLLNKFLLSNYGFRFPIFLTMCHMSACAFLSYVSIVFMKLVPLQPIKSRPQFLKIATLSVVFCGSVVGGNISLRYLPVSFNQAVGATTPFFTALFAYFMTFKREAWVTYAALVPVVAGVVIASGRKVELDEFATLYVPNCSSSFSACSTYNGAQCVRSHLIPWKTTQIHVAASFH